ncbi:DoxX family protein [Demequina oxidasica]|uniref:DoxX family protein n=1 Tax=Demequina oxidasica TaxID=676199 RepID=UPI000A7A8F5E
MKHFSDAQVRGIGAAEILGGLGLILPAVTGIAVILVPIAATGLLLTMIGAVVIHAKDGDPLKAFAPSIVLGAVALLVAVGRFWIVPFGG